jgi:ketohexokinase
MSDSRKFSARGLLGVGIATLDIVNEVAAYPGEDEEIRALSQELRPGGNVANSLALLGQLGHQCSWCGTYAGDVQGREVLTRLKGRGIDTSQAVCHAQAVTPTSYVTSSLATGSRTIVHFRDLPELGAKDFSAVPLDGLDWIHFEGRNPEETTRMLRDCAGRRPNLPLSLEIEKPRPGIERLLDGPSVLFFSRIFALSRGYEDPEAFLRNQRERTSAELLFLAWGDGGAYAQARGAVPCFAPAHSPGRVVDTLGAGDVFNAGVIDGLLAGLDLPAVLTRATRLAGHKCGMRGLDGVVVSALGAGLL